MHIIRFVRGNGRRSFEFEFTSTLKNMTVGIIGLGNIGALLCRKLHLLGVSMIGYDTYLREEEMDRLPVKSAETMEEVFQEADIVTVHLRLTAENHGIIGRDLLSLMKPKAYLINVARAGLIEGEGSDRNIDRT